MNAPGTVLRRPWIGQSYSRGFNGRRVLVLGESHYDWPARKFPVESLTIDCVQAHIDRGDQSEQEFWCKIEELLTGARVTPGLRNAFWDQIAFHNYVVDLLEDGHARPTMAQWEASRAPFLALVANLKPHFILVLGMGTWINLPAEPRKGPAIAEAKRSETCFYGWDGGEALAYAIEHPMYRFFGRTADWHSGVNQAMGLAPRL